jgi:hypothetical protein
MEYDYLVFNGQQECVEANNKIWCNLLLSYSDNTEKLVGNGEGNDYYLSEIETMPEHTLCDLKMYGKRVGEIQNTTAFTLRWDFQYNRLDDPTKWVIVKPSDDLMTGVINYTIEQSNPSWFPESQI